MTQGQMTQGKSPVLQKIARAPAGAGDQPVLQKMARATAGSGHPPVLQKMARAPAGCGNSLQTFLNSKLFLHHPIVNVEELSPWMMMPRNPVVLDPVPVVLDPVPVVFDPVPVVPPPPKKSVDGLFWSVYYLHHGLYPQDKNVEMQEKINVVKWAWENRSAILAQSRMSATKLQEYTAEIMSNSNKTTWGALYLECLFYKINVRILHAEKPIYMDFVGLVGADYIQIQDKTYQQQQQDDSSSDKIAVDFKQPAPLKGQGNYRVDDLKTLAQKLGLDVLEAPDNKKKDWYEAVYKALAW
jgi:hypothetical protein